MTTNPYVTTADAARIIGIKHKSMGDAIRRGYLPATKIGDRCWLIHLSDLERYAENRPEWRKQSPSQD